MKPLFLFLLFFGISSLQAQKLGITGRVVDEQNAPLPGAHVSLQHPWGESVTATATQADGTFRLDGLSKGGYNLLITFLGYADGTTEVNLLGEDLALGSIYLQPSTKLLAEVEVKGQVPMARVSGDTTEFNADAFKVLKDASAEDLVSKLPTVTVENGKVQAQGEDVKEVLVDGRRFFGNDPTAALRSLPAEVIQNIQIFDQESEQSQFTGFSDGNTSKTINIVTRKNMRNGQFGKVYAGYGTDDRYQSGGNINYFKEDLRLSLIGMSNNVNVQNFSAEDLLGVMGSGGRGWGGRSGHGRSGGSGGPGDFLVQQSGGIARTHAIGLNFSDKWGQKTEISGNYFFNQSRNNASSLLTRQFVDPEGEGEFYEEKSSTFTNNTNHRFSARLEHGIDSSNSIVFRPNLTLQFNDGNSTTLGLTTLLDDLLNQTDNTYSSDLQAINFNSSLLWRHKFAKTGRTVSANVSPGYNPKSGGSALRSFNAFYQNPLRLDTLDQQSTLDVHSWNVAAEISYTEPINESSRVEASYRASWQQEESDKYTNDFLESTGEYDLLVEQLSNVFSNDYYTQRAGLGYSYNKGRDLNITLRTQYQWARLDNKQTFPNQLNTDQGWNSVLPYAMLRYTLRPGANLRLNYRTRTNLPSVEQLQNVVSNSNPLQLSTGNPNLEQSYQHSLFLRYQSTNAEKGTVFFAMLGGSVSAGQIANATYYANTTNPIYEELGIERTGQLRLPVNLGGYHSLRSFITYGMPLKPIKSNLNLNLSFTNTRSPGLLNDALNYANSYSASVGVSITSNVSTQVEFTLSSRSNLNRVRNTLQQQSNSNYLIQNSSARLNWIVFKGFVVRSDLTNLLYNGLGDVFDQNYWLWNFGIGKKLFKNERGELTLSINDLLNQNRNITRNITEAYIEDRRTNNLQQYFILTFTYQIRNFNTGNTTPNNGTPSIWPGGMRPPWFRG